MSCTPGTFIADGVGLPERMPAPPAREFLTSAGFAGAAALLAAVLLGALILIGLMRAAKRDRLQREQQEHHFEQVRQEQRHNAAIERCWQRLVWVVETAGIEPVSNQSASVGLGPELALEILRGLLRDAENLGDDTLAGAVRVYLNQFSLVLAAQSGPLSAQVGPLAPVPADDKQQTAESAAPESSPSKTDPVSAAAKRVPAGGGRRRRQ